MSILLSGSIAYDTILEHPQPFATHLQGQTFDKINLSFSTPVMRRCYGGCAANIAYAIAQLQGDPFLWGALGSDGQDYIRYWENLGLSSEGLHILPEFFSAQCFIVTDSQGNQLASYHPGASDHTETIPLPPSHKNFSWGIVSPTNVAGMMAHTLYCAQHQIPCILDLGQATPLFTTEQLHQIIANAPVLAFSDFEATLIEQKIGLTPQALARQGKVIYWTHGADGCTLLDSQFEKRYPTPSVKAIDPVGAGDAFRGGLLWALEKGVSYEKALQIGTLFGAKKVQYQGGQNYQYPLSTLKQDYQEFWQQAWPI